jgi:aminoglycoside 3-N-acetyltransferase
VITARDLTTALRRLGVAQTDTVFVHSDVRRCLRMEGTTRAQKLATIVRGLGDSVADGALVLPTFTYSLCRGEVFDLRRSPSRVGVLSEHFRSLPGVRRTADPIFSTAVRGRVPAVWEARLFEVGDKDCFGPHSMFGYLLHADAKLLFFGIAPTACTFIHHVEQCEHVSYRYFKEFSGLVASDAGIAPVTARYYVRDLDSDVETFLVPLVDALRADGRLADMRIARGPRVWLTSARAVAAAAAEGLRENDSYLLERGHPELAHLHYA